MTRDSDDKDDRDVMVRVPFWLKQMAMEVGKRREPVESVGAVLARIAGKQLEREHNSLPKLRAAKQGA